LGVSLMGQCYTSSLIPLGGIYQHAVPERDIAEPDDIVAVRGRSRHPRITAMRGAPG
jgi:hypothetical protein